MERIARLSQEEAKKELLARLDETLITEKAERIRKMEEEIKPQTIELTDYEKKQEEEAIISYDELLKVKDRIYNITEDEETDEFIDQLKSFRLDL